ncbi:hypothetical protein AAKU67_001944 [Oxalobacteraceae bacterium GrIS 2.11]
MQARKIAGGDRLAITFHCVLGEQELGITFLDIATDRNHIWRLDFARVTQMLIDGVGRKVAHRAIPCAKPNRIEHDVQYGIERDQ